MKVSKGQSQPKIAAADLLDSLHGSGFTILIPGFDCGSNGNGVLSVCLSNLHQKKVAPQKQRRGSQNRWFALTPKRWGTYWHRAGALLGTEHFSVVVLGVDPFSFFPTIVHRSIHNSAFPSEVWYAGKIRLGQSGWTNSLLVLREWGLHRTNHALRVRAGCEPLANWVVHPSRLLQT